MIWSRTFNCTLCEEEKRHPQQQGIPKLARGGERGNWSLKTYYWSTTLSALKALLIPALLMIGSIPLSHAGQVGRDNGFGGFGNPARFEHGNQGYHRPHGSGASFWHLPHLFPRRIRAGVFPNQGYGYARAYGYPWSPYRSYPTQSLPDNPYFEGSHF